MRALVGVETGQMSIRELKAVSIIRVDVAGGKRWIFDVFGLPALTYASSLAR